MGRRGDQRRDRAGVDQHSVELADERRFHRRGARPEALSAPEAATKS